MRDAGASVVGGQGGRPRINLEESWADEMERELGPRSQVGRGSEEAAEGVWERGFSRQDQDCPPPRHKGGAEGFGDARILNP